MPPIWTFSGGAVLGDFQGWESWRVRLRRLSVPRYVTTMKFLCVEKAKSVTVSFRMDFRNVYCIRLPIRLRVYPYHLVRSPMHLRRQELGKPSIHSAHKISKLRIVLRVVLNSTEITMI